MRSLSTIERAPLGLIGHTERHESPEEIVVRHASSARGLREIFFSFEVRVCIRFQHIHLSIGRHTEIHARTARQAERAIYPARQRVEPRLYGSGQLGSSARRDAVLRLVL